VEVGVGVGMYSVMKLSIHLLHLSTASPNVSVIRPEPTTDAVTSNCEREKADKSSMERGV
jgi:hypothetical protein